MIKLQDGGRGKFKPAPNYSIEEVKSTLLEKIEEEMQLVIDQTDTYHSEDLHYVENKSSIISLFCGAGGLDLGVELAGLDIKLGKKQVNKALKNKDMYMKIREEGIFNHVYSNDFFKEALETYNNNFPDSVFTHNHDIRKVKQFPKGDLVLGGFPCPGFSEAGPRLVDDPRNFLYIHYIRCLMQVKPKFFIAENVKGMLTLGKGEVFRQIKQDFEAAGYKVYHKLMNARDYGVPQIRERVFLVGVRDDIEFEYTFPEPTHGSESGLKPYVTLKDAIGDLEENPGEYFTGSYSTIFMSRNRKKSWNDQSFTIQASGRQAPIHPAGPAMIKMETNKWIFPDGEENHRRLSATEIARIQTFPDWYEFSKGKNEKISRNGALDKIYKQIGNAVPVELARAVAQPIAEWFQQNNLRGECTLPHPETNVLIALKNMLIWNNPSMPSIIDYTSNNRINSTGDLLEYYIKDAFCGESAELEVDAEKLSKYQQHFSYLGNSNNPPDFIIQGGPAVEVKKVEGNGVGYLALNSSFPKNYLHNNDIRINRNCRECENSIGGWSRKDMIYAVGNVQGEKLKNLWLVYGDCYAADKETYERIARTIKDGVSAIPGVEFGETKELGRVNRVDPLGITHLRVRGMWTIQHPSAVFRTITNPDPAHTHIYVLMRKDKHEQIINKPDFTEYIKKEVLTIRDVNIPNPDNPAQTIEAILYTALI